MSPANPKSPAKAPASPPKTKGPVMPWMMDAGTHRSHMMITPANK